MITATGKDIQRALEDFDDEGQSDRGGGVPSRIYTPEAFLDLIVKWIIDDDQVCLYHFIWFLY